MYIEYFAKPWLEVLVGYQAGRLIRDEDGQRVMPHDFLASDGGFVSCHACPEEGERFFRKRHTMAAYIRKHRHCGRPPADRGTEQA